MKLYLKSIKLHFKSEMEYKGAFIISIISQFILFFAQIFTVIALFDKFSNIKGFTLYEVLLCYGIITFGFAFCEVFARGIDAFDKLIIDGSFDRLLLRPKSIMLQVLCSDANFIKLARLIMSLLVVVIALFKLNINLSLLKILCLILMLVSAVIIFFGIFVVAASYCFISIQGLEFRNLLTDGGRHLAQYPIGIFKKGFAFFFTFIIPYAFVNYYPLLYFLGKNNNVIYAFTPIITIIYLVPSLFIFKLGMKKYSSTGS